MAQLNLTAAEDSRIFFVLQYKGDKRDEAAQVCLAGPNLPVSARSVGKKREEEFRKN